MHNSETSPPQDHDKPIAARKLYAALNEIFMPILAERSTQTFFDDLARHGVDLTNGEAFSLRRISAALDTQLGKELSQTIIKQLEEKLTSGS